MPPRPPSTSTRVEKMEIMAKKNPFFSRNARGLPQDFIFPKNPLIFVLRFYTATFLSSGRNVVVLLTALFSRLSGSPALICPQGFLLSLN
jgi:hypothetical protein